MLDPGFLADETDEVVRPGAVRAIGGDGVPGGVLRLHWGRLLR
ncbi:MAG TPA: hypothetical protein VMF60_00930 [Acidimicrobiales bacterium]|nr:hypothetical protein [Acidimicrobiales bacterium]